MNKCRNCEYLVIDTVNKDFSRGRGHCFRKKRYKYEEKFKEYYGFYVNGDAITRYFGDSICPKFKQRISTHEIGRGTE